MSRYAKITVFIVLSFSLHLLFLFIEIPAPPSFQTARTLGVGLVQRSFPQFSSQRQRTAQVNTLPVISQPETPKESTTIPAVLKPEPVKAESVTTPAKRLPPPPVPVVEKLSGEKAVPFAPEAPLTSRTASSRGPVVSTPQPHAVGSGDKKPSVAENNPSAAGIDSRPDVEKLVFQDALPHYDQNPHPVYPEVSRRRGQQGTVLLEVAVQADGSVEKVSLSQSSGYKVLDRAALTTVRRWRFRPATSAGIAVASRVVVPVDFVLQTE